MALITCPDCEKRISDSAPVCPNCGRPAAVPAVTAPASAPPAPQTQGSSGIGWVFGGGLVLLLAGMCKLTSGDSKPYVPPAEFTADVRFTGTQFTITNKSGHLWGDCIFEVNDDYTYSAPYLGINDSLTVGALNFTSKSGERFNPFTRAPKRFKVDCERPSEMVPYESQWK